MGKILSLVIMCSVLMMSGAAWGENRQLRGTIMDEAGKPVAGAELFLYDSAKTKRQADYISAKTGADGKFTMVVPSAVYWGVARVRHGDKYGPLLAGDLHSGEPLEIDLAERGQDIVFTVAEIQELSKTKTKSQNALSRLEGKVLDQGGLPVAGATVYVWREPWSERLPDLVSSWTEKKGGYALYLAPGSYLVTASTEFPPRATADNMVKLTVAEGQKTVALNLQVIKMEADSTSSSVNLPADGVSLDDE